jgi:hypothetical protein
VELLKEKKRSQMTMNAADDGPTVTLFPKNHVPSDDYGLASAGVTPSHPLNKQPSIPALPPTLHHTSSEEGGGFTSQRIRQALEAWNTQTHE